MAIAYHTDYRTSGKTVKAAIFPPYQAAQGGCYRSAMPSWDIQ